MLFVGIILPTLLVVVIAFLLWRMATSTASQGETLLHHPRLLSSHIAAIIGAASFLAADVIYLRSTLESYSTKASVMGSDSESDSAVSAEIIDNEWWSSTYGDEYQIGRDSYLESFCIPRQQFALVSLTWQCPKMAGIFLTFSENSCQGSILAWDCDHREICREDCEVAADDGMGDPDQCDYANDDDQANDNNGDDGGQWQQTEDQLVQCAQELYPDYQEVDIVSDCLRCNASGPLTAEDYEWVHGEKDGSVTPTMFAIIGMLSCALSFFFHRRHHSDIDERMTMAVHDSNCNEQIGKEFHPID